MKRRRIVKNGCEWTEDDFLEDRERLTPAALGAAVSGDMENTVAAMTPGGIERQEAAAQKRLVSTQSVPIKLGSPRELFEKLGFKFGKILDAKLQEAEIPAGWTKVPSPSHSSYSHVLDPKGRARWTIYFKGAFHDYEAFGYGLQRRYVVRTETDYDYKGAGEKPERGVVLDYGVKFDPKEMDHGGVKPKVLHSTHDGWVGPKSLWDHERVRRMLALEMELWLDARFPGHEDPLAHWD